MASCFTPERWTPWTPAFRRARSAETASLGHFWDFRSAREGLLERQRMQAALLKVALRADGRAVSVPAPRGLRRFLLDETLDGHSAPRSSCLLWR